MAAIDGLFGASDVVACRGIFVMLLSRSYCRLAQGRGQSVFFVSTQAYNHQGQGRSLCAESLYRIPCILTRLNRRYPLPFAAEMHPSTPQNRKIISVGPETELVWLRDAVLRSAGFDVFSTSEENLALEKIRAACSNVLLLYYRLASGAAERLATAFRKHCRKGRIVVVSNSAMEKPDFADDLLYKLDGPQALIEAIRKCGDPAAGSNSASAT